jgi:ATP-dependent Zn protease
MVRHRPPAVPVPSPVYAQIIDAEVQRLLGEGYNRALDILRADRDVLACLAKLLLEKEVVERTELRELVGTSWLREFPFAAVIAAGEATGVADAPRLSR